MIEGFADCDGHWIQSSQQTAGFKKIQNFLKGTPKSVL